MSLTLIPRSKPKPVRKHRAADRVTFLNTQVAELRRKLTAADVLIRELIGAKSDAIRDQRAAEAAHRSAEEVIEVRDQQIRNLKAQLQAAREAHPPAAPSPTASRFEAGPVIRLGARTPVHVPPVDSETPQRIPLDQLPTIAAA
ncbi:hypothetical protein [Streptomyces microflavus]|uniref:hypothetical protein n=1 Tax=Streptomyces microflavus TaxID=1919 RepID=UPI002E2ECD82|nr:hypothetical protein [Streptomyces microflavus]